MSDSAPAYRVPLLHFDALRLVALRGGHGKILATENVREMLIRAPAHVHSAHAALCCWSKLAAYSQPALRTGLMAPAWRPAIFILRVTYGSFLTSPRALKVSSSSDCLALQLRS